MYFWRIEKLKTQMAARPLSEREALPYLVVFVGLSAAVSYIPQTMSNVWDGLGAACSIALALVGTIYIYRQNGGPLPDVRHRSSVLLETPNICITDEIGSSG